MGPDPHDAWRQITPEALAALGTPQLAYIKPVETEAGLMFAVHAADGRELGMAPSHTAALAAIWDNDLEPASLN